MTIYFDMDGTIANFYGVDGWLENLIASNPRPYAEAKPLFNFSAFARQLHRLQAKGIKVGIISWLAKNSTAEFDAVVADTKKAWLAKHLPSVEFDEIHILKYGTPKSTAGCGILFDDEEPNRNEWGAGAYNVENLLDTLKTF